MGVLQPDWPQSFTLVSGCSNRLAAGLSDGEHFIKSNEGPWIIGLICYRNGCRKKPQVLCRLSGQRSPHCNLSPVNRPEARTRPVWILDSGVPGHSEKRDSHKTDFTSLRPFQILRPSLLLHHLSTQQGNSSGWHPPKNWELKSDAAVTGLLENRLYHWAMIYLFLMFSWRMGLLSLFCMPPTKHPNILVSCIILFLKIFICMFGCTGP